MQVTLKKVSKRFANAEVDAVNQVDLEIVNK